MISTVSHIMGELLLYSVMLLNLYLSPNHLKKDLVYIVCLGFPNVSGPRTSTSCTNWGDLNLDPSLLHVLLPFIELH